MFLKTQNFLGSFLKLFRQEWNVGPLSVFDISVYFDLKSERKRVMKESMYKKKRDDRISSAVGYVE